MFKIASMIDEACKANSPKIYDNMGTADAARDMDEIRTALDEEKLNFIGFSYGTLLGTYYANLFPDKVRAFILDGALNPESTPRDIQTGGTQAAERGLKAFLADCTADQSCPFNDGTNLSKRFSKLMDKFAGAPLPVAFKEGGKVDVGSAVAYLAVMEGLVDGTSGWPVLANALAKAEKSEGLPLAKLYSQNVGFNPDGSWKTYQEPSYFTIGHASALFSNDINDFKGLGQYGPLMAKGVIALNVMGSYFNVQPDRQTGPMPATGAPPILVISATRDPSTLYEWGVDLAKQLDSGVLITRKGDGHTSINKGNECVLKIAWGYLNDPATAPPRATGAVC
jgi:pimeloyl-ACP methyl ester carboxylesterase